MFLLHEKINNWIILFQGCESKGKLNQKMKMSSKILDIDWKIKTDNDQICVIYSLFQILLDRPDFPWSLRFKIDC